MIGVGKNPANQLLPLASKYLFLMNQAEPGVLFARLSLTYGPVRIIHEQLNVHHIVCEVWRLNSSSWQLHGNNIRFVFFFFRRQSTFKGVKWLGKWYIFYSISNRKCWVNYGSVPQFLYVTPPHLGSLTKRRLCEDVLPMPIGTFGSWKSQKMPPKGPSNVQTSYK